MNSQSNNDAKSEENYEEDEDDYEVEFDQSQNSPVNSEKSVKSAEGPYKGTRFSISKNFQQSTSSIQSGGNKIISANTKKVSHGHNNDSLGPNEFNCTSIRKSSTQPESSSKKGSIKMPNGVNKNSHSSNEVKKNSRVSVSNNTRSKSKNKG